MRPSNFDPVSVALFQRQLKRICLGVIVVFAILLLRLWFMQVMNGTQYRTKSEDNRIRLQDLVPFRGRIFDRHGAVLVDNRPSYDLYVIPEEVRNRAQLLENLHCLASIDVDAAEGKIRKVERRYPFSAVCLKRDISRDELAAIETQRFNLPGVLIKVKPQRHYPSGHLASHLLGYLGEINEDQLRSGRYSGSKGGDLIGKSGVELKWQGLLCGMRGGEQVEVDAAGRVIRVISRKPAVPGASIYLTIDKDLQALAESALEGVKGAVVALDPADGQVLALASNPSFDPNLFIGGIDQAVWNRISSSNEFPLQNRAITGQYPPGSVFKVVVALAGLQEGVIDPSQEEFCNGTFTLGRGSYRCWKKHGHGKVDLYRALVESCDVYFYKVGKKLGLDTIARYARKCGLGTKTGFELGQEKAGLVPSDEWKMRRFGVPWQGGETISLSIGQSFLLVTPIQAAAMMSAVFNGGILYKPHVTRWIGKDHGETLHSFSPVEKGSLGVDAAHLELIKRALAGAVNDRRGTGTKARLELVTVAGKTGTAQVVTLEKEKMFDEQGEVPARFRDHAWFVAVAPAENPRISVAVLVEHGGHGGSAAAPIAKKIIQAYVGVTE